MKRPLALLFIALVGCASLTGQSQSVQSVLARSQQFDGHVVRVCGWFVSGMETCTVSQIQPIPGALAPADDTVWVTPKSAICTPLNAFRNPQATWAVVEGSFHTGGGFGHLGQYQHALVGGTVRPIRGDCSGIGSAPNNSFKPKPLRGSA